MNIYFAMGLNFLPLILFFLFVKKVADPKISTELISCALGLLAVFPIVFIKCYIVEMKWIVENPVSCSSMLSNSLVYSGLTEEVIKALFIFLIPGVKKDFKKFFFCAMLFGLCLGCFESMAYVFKYLSVPLKAGETRAYDLIFERMFSSDLIHGACAGLSGILIYTIRNKRCDFAAIIISVFIHGIYDFFASFNTNMKWFALIAILFALIECRVHYQKYSEKHQEKTGDEKGAGKSSTKSVSKASVAKSGTKSGTKSSTKTGSKAETKTGEKESETKSRSTAGTKSGSKTAKKDSSSDATVVTAAPKRVSKKAAESGDKPAARTKTRARKVKQVEEEVQLDPDVTPEFNDEI